MSRAQRNRIIEKPPNAMSIEEFIRENKSNEKWKALSSYREYLENKGFNVRNNRNVFIVTEYKDGELKRYIINTNHKDILDQIEEYS